MTIDVEEKARDFQKLVSEEVVETFYIPHRELKYLDKADTWDKNVVGYPRLDLTEEDGCITTITFKLRRNLANGDMAEIYRDEYGREVTADERSRMPDEAQRRLAVPFKVWDGRVSSVVETDGPEQRKILLQTYEQNKLQTRKERETSEASQVKLAEAIDNFASAIEPIPEGAPRRGPGRPRKEQ